MAHSCSGCGYAYEEGAIEAGLPDERSCPVCGSSSVTVKVMLPTLTVSSVALPVGILITANLWSAWLNIAIERAIEACRIRTEMLLVRDNGGEIAALLGDEFQASMVAVAASAHALDALYGSAAIPQSVRDQRRTFGKGSRRGNIQEALKTVFDVGTVMTGWVPEFEWLFDLRDAAAHSLEVAETPVPHPAGTNTSPVQVNYSVESAKRAVSFALSVLHWCIDHPRRRDPLAVKWSAEMRPVVEGLERRWREGGRQHD
jgi:rubredoxin